MTDPRAHAVETKLMAARTRLILDKPFIGALIMHLPLRASSACERVATDASSLYFNPRYIESLTLAHVQFVLAHAAMHCALGHFARRAHRVRKRWDVACDHAVNLILLEEGLAAPAGALADRAYRGLCAEEIYPLIADDMSAATLDEHRFERWQSGSGVSAWASGTASEGAGNTPSGDDSDQDAADAELWSDAGSYRRLNSASAHADMRTADLALEDLTQQWRMRFATAAQQALQAGRLSASWQRMLGHAIAPKLAWRALLARHLSALARDDYSFQRPARREGAAVLPRLSSSLLDVIAVLDTSGSIGANELREFAAEIDGLKGEVRARVTIHACDDKLVAGGPWSFEPWQRVALPERIPGGGSTCFVPIFEWVAEQGACPDALIYFTDAEGEFPSRPPPYPVIWVVKGRATVPFGERIQLN